MSFDRSQLVADVAQKWPQSIAIIESSRSFTYLQLHDGVKSRAAVISTELRMSSANAPILPLEGTASIDYIVELLAIVTSGAVAAPLNMRYPASSRLDQKQGILACNNSDAVLLVHTSGSSGNSKRVFFSLSNMITSAIGVNEALAFSHGDRWLCPLPLWHVGGLGILFRCLVSGGTIVLTDSTDLAKIIRTHSPTHLSLVDAQWSRILNDPSAVAHLKNICRAILLGGSAISTARVQMGVASGLPVYLSYGLTEMSSTVTMKKVAAEDLLRSPLSSGTLLADRQLRISNDGIIEVNGPARFLGYLENENISSPFDSNGWYSTGDRGSVNDQGELVVLGRVDYMFISGGENIQPEEIELVLRSDSRIDEVVIVPIRSERYGQRPVAIVRLTVACPVHDLQPELESLLRMRLPGYMIPSAWLSWPPVSDNAADIKINRRELQNYAARQLSLQPKLQ